MRVIVIIDKYIDEREFRNYSSYWITKLGFSKVEIEDPTLSDDDPTNNNDINAIKDNKPYTIQTFLNKNITKKEVEETIADMKKEKVDNGLIITNKDVSDEFKEYASINSIEIIDKDSFTEIIN